MSKKADQYRTQLRTTKDVETFLKRLSGLPGPRGNLELAHAFAQEATPAGIWRLAALEPARAPENTPEGFLAFCGVLGLGRLAVENDGRAEDMLRRRASDPRWRVREAVATALQLIGDRDRSRFVRLVTAFAGGNALERRAAVAAVAEPRLLEGEVPRTALALLGRVTRSLGRSPRPLGEAGKVLLRALAYAWSVVVAADPAAGKPAMETWLRSSDPDVGWAMRENLRKKRLQKVDSAWCSRWARQLDAAPPARAPPGQRRRGRVGSGRSGAARQTPMPR